MRNAQVYPVRIWLIFEVKLLTLLLLVLLPALWEYHSQLSADLTVLYFLPIALGIYFFRAWGLLTVGLSAWGYYLARVFTPQGAYALWHHQWTVYLAFMGFGVFILYLLQTRDNLSRLNRSFSRIVSFQRAVLSAHPAGILVVGKDGGIVEIGKAAEILLGIQGEKWLGRKIDELEAPAVLKEKLKIQQPASQDLPLDNRVIHWNCVSVYDRDSEEEIGFAHLLSDITERVKAEQRLLEITRLLSLKEARNRFAAHLHDELAQMLSAVKMRVELSENLLSGGDSEAAQREIRQAEELLALVLKDLRRSILELRPVALEKKPLLAALEEYLQQFAQYTNLQISFKAPEDFSLTGESELWLFYLIQEAVTNAYKHSGSPEIKVEIQKKASGWQAVVEDHGRGLESRTAVGGLGLTDMREKAGLMGAEFRIESRESWPPDAENGATRIIVDYRGDN